MLAVIKLLLKLSHCILTPTLYRPTGEKVWNIDSNFVVFKNKYKNKSKNLCLVKFEVLGYKNM